jgi:hypothetical protein
MEATQKRRELEIEEREESGESHLKQINNTLMSENFIIKGLQDISKVYIKQSNYT